MTELPSDLVTIRPARPQVRKPVGPRLRWLLMAVFALFALLGVNSVYLASITFLEWWTERTYQDAFYLWSFLLHILLGLLLVVPAILFSVGHIRNTYTRRNRRAVRAGFGLFAAAILLLVTGLLLLRLEGLYVVRDPTTRQAIYWAHVLLPLVVVWLFVLHRLAGRRIKWRVGATWGAVAGSFAVVMLALHAQDPRDWGSVGPEEGERYFFPSLSRTSTGDFIPAATLMMDDYCQQCHPDVHDSWLHSAHRESSFSNPAYLFSVRQTREFALERDGNVQAARWCAGCHDPVPFFSGRFDDPHFDLQHDPTAHAGITCTSCHAITHVNSPRGNADYTIEEPLHYPFAVSDNRVLQWVNRQLILAKPEFHKRTFLKPLHRTSEFCGACHKVHLPVQLNDYKWLRGQNHYDSFLLSGVSGHGASSFYYPDKAETNCNDCHMPLMPSEDFGARLYGDSGQRMIRDHMFPSANTFLAHVHGWDDRVIDRHQAFNEGVMRVDIFGLREGGELSGELVAPLRPDVPALQRGRTYLLENVIRTVRMGHHFTQGTVDSNQVWLDVELTSGGRVIGRSGGKDPADRSVDPWSHFVNVYMLDRHGNRIDRRNPQDIFTPLYDNQIPPGAADTVLYRFTVPQQTGDTVTARVRLRYRKFDTAYMRLVKDDDDYVNQLPIMTLAEDQVTFPVTGGRAVVEHQERGIDTWQRWNDYGIGLLRKSDRKGAGGALRQAEHAFAQVESLGRPDGPLNLARVYFTEGRLDDAVAALQRASRFDPPAPAWTVLWFTGLVNKQNGYLDDAIDNFTQIIEGGFEQAAGRGFDFSKDYRVLNELGQTVFERSRLERGDQRRAARERLLRDAERWFGRVLDLDPENVTAHYNLAQVYRELDDPQRASRHRALHARYKPDDNARDRAIAAARRREPAADAAADPVVIYHLQRDGAYELPEQLQRVSSND